MLTTKLHRSKLGTSEDFLDSWINLSSKIFVVVNEKGSFFRFFLLFDVF